MKINRVEIDNFMAIGEATLTLDNQGLVLIQGDNKDDSSQNSNGAGKSSVVEAINWCLFGETARGDTADTIVNLKEGKNARVLVQLVDGERTYNVIRHRKHSDHKNRLMLVDVTSADDVVDKTQGTDKATQLAVEQLIGCSSEVFRAAIYYGQESQTSLPDQTDKMLKQIVEEAAGIEKMIEAYLMARSDYSAAKDEADAALRAKQNCQTILSSSKSRIESLAEERKLKAAEIQAQAASHVEKAKSLVSSRAAVITELGAIDKASLEAEKMKLVDEIGSLKHQAEHLEELRKKYTRQEHEVKTLERDIESRKASAKVIKQKLDNLNAEIGTSCDQCGNVIAESNIASRAKSLSESFKGDVNKAKDLLTQLASVREALSNALKDMEEHKASMTDVSASSARLSEIDKALLHAEKLAANAEYLAKEANTQKEIASKLLKGDNPVDKIVEAEKKRLEEAEAALDAALARCEEVEKELKIALEVSDIFSPSGIRAHILDTVTPFLNDRTARYLGILSDGNIEAIWSTLTKGAKGELKEKFAIEVLSKTGADTFKSLSGGEKRKVRLSTALALQDLVSSRATKPIGLWIGDEIDDAVDVSGLERLMTVLEEKAKEKGTVLIISHNELSDWCRQQATVVKHEGRATVSGSLVIPRESVGL